MNDTATTATPRHPADVTHEGTLMTQHTPPQHPLDETGKPLGQEARPGRELSLSNPMSVRPTVRYR